MRRVLLVGGIMTTAAVVLCCSSFDDGGDAASSPDDAAVIDASPVLPDGSAVGDASPPSNDGGVDCKSPKVLCDDFNRPNPPLVHPTWSGEEGDAAVREIQSATFDSTPSALLVDMADAGEGYMLSRTFTGPLSKLHCSFSYYLDKDPPPAGYGELLEVSLDTAFSTRLLVYTDSSSVWDSANHPHDFVALVTGVWHHIAFELPSMRTWYNGVEKTPLADAGGIAGPFGAATFKIGVFTNAGDPGWRVFVDDVLCVAE